MRHREQRSRTSSNRSGRYWGSRCGKSGESQDRRVKQSNIATLGRLDKLTASGAIDQLLRSAARFAERLMVLAESSTDSLDSPDATVVSTGDGSPTRRLSSTCRP